MDGSLCGVPEKNFSFFLIELHFNLLLSIITAVLFTTEAVSGINLAMKVASGCNMFEPLT